MDGTGNKLKVHDRSQCAGEFCSIHNPSNHIMKDWPTHWREDRGIMERMCECGVGHPDPDDIAFKRRMAIKQFPSAPTYDEGIHGCCGCCSGKKL